jgi:hypothetical protein
LIDAAGRSLDRWGSRAVGLDWTERSPVMVGPINRSERARLSADAQPYQAVVDATLFRLVGFSQVDAISLKQ